ncbi:MAG: hypothetical protein J5501_05150 [Ruminococcus sp.]|nr:hypothetical protein [Ruminococcus sp.]
MKKIAAVVLAAALLTGCQSVDKPELASQEPEKPGLAPSDSSWTWESAQLRDDVRNAYEGVVQDRIIIVAEEIRKKDEEGKSKEEIAALYAKDDKGNTIYNPYDYVDISFTLFDIDKDNVPELIMTYGTMIDDKQLAVYTYADDKVKVVAEDEPAVRCYFASDTATGEFALVKGGGSGSASISWYAIGANGLEETRNTGEITYAENESFVDTMKEKGVAWLEFTEFYGSSTTWKIRYPDGVYELEEPTNKDGSGVGYDYSQFEEMIG